MKNYRLLLLVLLLAFSTAWNTTKAQTSPKLICIPEAKAAQIDRDLAKYPLVVQENKKLHISIDGYELNNAKLRREAAEKDSALAASDRQIALEKVLRQNAEGQATVWKHKARKRGWQNVGLVGVITLIIGAVVTSR